MPKDSRRRTRSARHAASLRALTAALFVGAAVAASQASAQFTPLPAGSPDFAPAAAPFDARQPVSERRIETRQELVWRPVTETTNERYVQTVLTPIRETRPVLRWSGRYDACGRPCMVTASEARLRYEPRQVTVERPVTRTRWVQETRTVQVPVVARGFVGESPRLSRSPTAPAVSARRVPLYGLSGAALQAALAPARQPTPEEASRMASGLSSGDGWRPATMRR